MSKERIHGLIAAVDVANHALDVNHEGRASGNTKEAKHPVLPGDFLVCIAKEWKGEAQLPREVSIGGRLVDADPHHLGARLFKTGKTILVCPQFLSSTWRVGIDIKGQDYSSLTSKVAKAEGPACVVGQLKIRRFIPDVQSHSGCPSGEYKIERQRRL